jgi:anti-sigma factor RsiW
MIGHSRNLEPACREFEEDLVLYYYGEGSEAERSRVENHANSCSRCSRFLSDLHKLLPRMSQPTELPQSFWDNYHREMVDKLAVQRERNIWWRNFFAPARLWVLPAFGTAAVAVLAIALVLGKGGSSFQPNRTQQNLPPEILTDAKQLEFFNSMDMLESLHLLEALDGSKTDPASQRS